MGANGRNMLGHSDMSLSTACNRPGLQSVDLEGAASGEHARSVAPVPTRITSIDALRGFVMFMMIFVNDLAGAGRILPDWMVHFSDRHPGESGMNFVDLVFPAFLFIVGMSIPFAFGTRISKGEPVSRLFGHVAARTLSLLFIGILMVHGTPDTTALGWSGNWWTVLMYLGAMAAFCSISPSARNGSSVEKWRRVSLCLRIIGLATLLWLAFAFRGWQGERIITLAPFSLDTQWYGILGLIGWAYLVTSVVFLAFGSNRTAILGCMVLLMCLFAADKAGLFDEFWLNKIVNIGGTLGSLTTISVGGLLLGTTLFKTDASGLRERSRFTFSFVIGCAAAALLLNRTYGISKNGATPFMVLVGLRDNRCNLVFVLSDRGRPSRAKPLSTAHARRPKRPACLSHFRDAARLTGSAWFEQHICSARDNGASSKFHARC